MIRKLLATSAIAAVIATGAFAQSTTTQPAPADPNATTDTMTPAPAATGDQAAAVKPAEGALATNIIGETVYNGTGDDAENIGDVNDLVLDDKGMVKSVVVGVGGFLGVGEKNVEMSYDKIDWAEKDGDRWIVVAATKDELDQLPAFDRRAYDPAPSAMSTSSTTEPAPAATTTEPAPAVKTEPAPAQ